jgi:hypothetical protein
MFVRRRSMRCKPIMSSTYLALLKDNPSDQNLENVSLAIY